MEGPSHEHLHQEWQEPLEELSIMAASVIRIIFFTE